MDINLKYLKMDIGSLDNHIFSVIIRSVCFIQVWYVQLEVLHVFLIFSLLT